MVAKNLGQTHSTDMIFATNHKCGRDMCVSQCWLLHTHLIDLQGYVTWLHGFLTKYRSLTIYGQGLLGLDPYCTELTCGENNKTQLRSFGSSSVQV